MSDPGRARAALALADWIESTRSAAGYGGPVAHWWRDCLVDCRPGHDWRYEGIIPAYLDLLAATGGPEWLARAGRAGDDLVAAQDANGAFAQSRFELNPGTAGTPHEAAADTGLLRFALAVRGTNAAAAQTYLAAARRNLDRLLAVLWDPLRARVADDPSHTSFVPNKACTTIEALALLAEATGEQRYLSAYALPTAEAVLALQVRRPGHRLDGAIAQNSLHGRVVAKYFPYYVARCIPGLLVAARLSGEERFAEAALAAGRFVARVRDADGAYPQVLYEDGRLNRYPRWVAAVGDVQRALDLLRPLGLETDGASAEWLLRGMLPNGAIRTADGFAIQATSHRPPDLPELRDLLPVAGWADKALRYLCAGLEGEAVAAAGVQAPAPFEADCTFAGRRLRLRLEGGAIELKQSGRTVYRWAPPARWAEVAAPWLVVR